MANRSPTVTRTQAPLDRRRFISAASGWLAGSAALAPWLWAAERPPVTVPRATSGDMAVEPTWDDRLTITVGPGKADLIGSDHRALQAAVDYVARLGGGTVRVLPGVFKLRNAVYLASNVRLLGSGVDSVLIKEPSLVTKLADDSDWFDQEITLAEPAGFQVGDGICLRTRNPSAGGKLVFVKRTLVARSGNRFKLDRALGDNFWLLGDTTVSTLFPLVSGENIVDAAVENIALDGNKDQNENLDGNYAGCVFLQDCSRVSMRGVTARHFDGDGLSWQVCHDVVVEDCHVHDNVGLGLHPGSGSQRPIIRRNKVERNDQGLFFCWGVKYGLAEENVLADNRRYGISIGHRDTDNLICRNEVLRSGEVGVLFRAERGTAFAPHRNRVEHNRIVDSGSDEGVGIDLLGQVRAVVLAHNEIRETREPGRRVGIRIGRETGDIQMVDNQIAGFATAVKDLHLA